jgi:amino acid adenylation domain-containing protein
LRQKLSRLVGSRKAPALGEEVEKVVDLSIYPPDQRRLWQTHIQALISYHPKPYAGTVTLFRAPAHPFLCSFDPLCGWADLATSVELKLVRGPHEGILDEPHVQFLARELKACLEKLARQQIKSNGTPGNSLPHPSNNGMSTSSLSPDNSPAARFAPVAGEIAPAAAAAILPEPKQALFWRVLKHPRYNRGIQIIVMLLTGLSLLLGRYVRFWQNRKDSMTKVPEYPRSDTPTATPAEQQRILIDWNATERDYPLANIYPRAFENQAGLTPDAPAIRFGGKDLSYAQFNAQSNQLAHLLQQMGVGPDSVVGLYLDRSFEYAISLLATFKAGGAFLPLQSGTPTARLQHIFQDARPVVVLTSEKLAAELPAGLGQVLRLDSAGCKRRLEGLPANRAPVCAATPDNLAYVIYTSGSTGVPKGVEISHRALLNHNYAVGDIFQLKPGERILQMGALSFDLSLEELLPGWLKGCCVVLRDEEIINSAAAFLAFVEAERIDILDLPTVFWQGLVQDLKERSWPASVRLVAIGGDSVSQEAVKTWKRVSLNAKLINTYGPTETTIISTYAVASSESDEVLSIGRPIANTKIYILDEQMRLLPPGVAGELYIGGAGLARGYRNRPELTASKFVADPFRPGERLFKTGDQARWRPDGNLEFLGRKDHQVKIRGYRIECGEIEAVLKKFPGIHDCLVVPFKEPGRDAQLVAYYQQRDGATVEESGLPGFLGEQLPDYMVPWAFVRVTHWPLTPHGKLDRAALPKPGKAAVHRSTEYVAPRTPEEAALARIWSEVLHREPIGVNDHFLDLGGNSLSAMQIASRIRDTFQAEIPVAGLFTHPTIAALAAGVLLANPRRRRRSEKTPAPEGPWPLSFAQQRLWFMEQLNPGSPVYNLPQAIRVQGELNPSALERALQEIVRRQRALRTVIVHENGELLQRLTEGGNFSLPVIDLQELPECERGQALEAGLREEAVRPFNLAADLMLRAKLFRLGPSEHVLLATLHHIAADGWSLDVLFKELLALYGEFNKGSTPEKTELPLQYAEYAAQERNEFQGESFAGKLEFWKAIARRRAPAAGTARRPPAPAAALRPRRPPASPN